jgi:predicted acyl esterase
MRLPIVPALIVTLLAGVAPAARAFDVQEGIGFLAITGSTQGTVFSLGDKKGRELQTGAADQFGSLIFRELEQGQRYVVQQQEGASKQAKVRTFRDLPPQSLYNGQSLHEGLQYIQTRDGTLLAAMVRAPIGKTLAQGPWPTVIEYSGYSAADPDSPQPSTLIASALGFATVGVNMRGSGCSGGVIDLFDLPTTADGYDIVETVAAQPWVLHGKVGMVGISFPGISQTFVAGSRPPHLAAVAPLSVIADIYRAPGFPGGIFNDGFAKSWLQERKDDAAPAPQGGQGWARKRVNNGDQTCLANQKLRLQTQDPIEFTTTHPFYLPALMDDRSPINWVGKIDVPTFLAGAWQDEQTGAGFASMLDRLPKRSDVKITVQNGVHTSSLDPEVLWNWLAFLDLYVAKRVPDASFLAQIAPIIYPQILGPNAPTPPLPTDRFAGIDDYDAALALFESDPHVRVLFENGAGSSIPGLPAPTFEEGFSTFPPKEAHPTAWYFGPDGTLVRNRPHGGGPSSDAFRPDPAARPERTSNGHEWDVIPPYDWRPIEGDTGVGYATSALAEDVTIVGPGSIDLWLRSSASDTDLQVTLSEIRPDGLETYVQSGWLRASHRRLDGKESSVIDPRPTHLERDAKPMPPGKFTKVRVGLYAVAHVFRKGSRIRLTIEAPGGDRTSWEFDSPATNGQVYNEVMRGPSKASRVVLAVVPGVVAPATLPPCPGLRGEPCRTYEPAGNGG